MPLLLWLPRRKFCGTQENILTTKVDAAKTLKIIGKGCTIIHMLRLEELGSKIQAENNLRMLFDLYQNTGCETKCHQSNPRIVLEN